MCGLPIVHPEHVVYRVWSAVILAADLTYTAFFIPLSVALGTPESVLDAWAVVDLVVGEIVLLPLF